MKKNCNTKVLLICGAIGGFLFVSIFLIAGLTRADYNPLRFPVSSLSIGSQGWIQITNFILSGSLITAFAFGLRNTLIGKTWIPGLIGMVGIGLIGAGICITDPVYGYPTTEPLALAQFTVRGHLHDFFSILVFISLPTACFKFRNRFKAMQERGWAAYSLFTAVLVITTFLLAGIGFKQTPVLVAVAGVFQRLCITAACVWISLIAFYFLKRSNP